MNKPKLEIVERDGCLYLPRDDGPGNDAVITPKWFPALRKYLNEGMVEVVATHDMAHGRIVYQMDIPKDATTPQSECSIRILVPGILVPAELDENEWPDCDEFDDRGQRIGG